MTSATRLTVDTVPAGWTTSTKLDVVEQNPGFDTVIFDEAPSAVSTGASGTVDFASTSGVSVDDWVCEAGFTPVVQVPDIMHSCLVLAVCSQVFESLGDAAGAEITAQRLDRALKGILETIEERNEGDHPKVVNRYSPLRAGRRWR